MSQANNIQVGGAHYKTQNIQPWDFIAANGLGFFEGNVVKYVCRHPLKGGLQPNLQNDKSLRMFNEAKQIITGLKLKIGGT